MPVDQRIKQRGLSWREDHIDQLGLGARRLKGESTIRNAAHGGKWIRRVVPGIRDDAGIVRSVALPLRLRSRLAWALSLRAFSFSLRCALLMGFGDTYFLFIWRPRL